MSVDPQAFLQPPAVPHGHVQPEIALSEGMADWLVAQQLSLAFTSYQSGRLVVAGVGPDRRLSFNEQYYARAMGLCYSGSTLHIASLFQIWSLQNLLREGEFANRMLETDALRDRPLIEVEDRVPGVPPADILFSANRIYAGNRSMSFTELALLSWLAGAAFILLVETSPI